MALIKILVNKIISDNPEIILKPSDHFSWLPDTNTILFDASEKNSEQLLLHELAHAKLKHTSYSKDIELISVEREAWDYAKVALSSLYNTPIDEDVVQEILDSYRDWMHARSTCPNCSATGVQKKQDTYSCLACHGLWRVNEARTCQLRRYRLV